MQATSTTCPTTIHLYRPLHVRALERLAEILYAAAEAWEARVARRRYEIESRAMADMNELLLRDIGAPDWMIAEASARREVDRQQLVEMYQGRRDLML
jgi:hypothetical protein